MKMRKWPRACDLPSLMGSSGPSLNRVSSLAEGAEGADGLTQHSRSCWQVSGAVVGLWRRAPLASAPHRRMRARGELEMGA